MKSFVISNKHLNKVEILVDEEDYDFVKDQIWYANVSTRSNNIKLSYIGLDPSKNEVYRIHHLILMRHGIEIPKGYVVDHIDHNPANNQKRNLRLCSNQQNKFNAPIQKNNTSGFRGVSWFAKTQSWRARIKINGKEKHIGIFKSPIDAAIAYNEVATNLFGEYAMLNEVNQ